MTNREAIKRLSGIRDSEYIIGAGLKKITFNEKAIEAFDLAISALEKQEADRWHSVAKEGNPKKSGLYIVTDNSKMDGNEPHTRYFNAYGEKAFWSGWRADEVIAWKEITSESYTEEEQ